MTTITLGPMPQDWLASIIFGNLYPQVQVLLPCDYCGAPGGTRCRTRTSGRPTGRFQHGARYWAVRDFLDPLIDQALTEAVKASADYVEWQAERARLQGGVA